MEMSLLYSWLEFVNMFKGHIKYLEFINGSEKQIIERKSLTEDE